MTDNTVTITILRSGFTVPDFEQTRPNYSSGRVAYRGEVLTFSPEAVEATRDALGSTWLDLDEEQQIARWGTVTSSWEIRSRPRASAA